MPAIPGGVIQYSQEEWKRGEKKIESSFGFYAYINRLILFGLSGGLAIRCKRVTLKHTRDEQEAQVEKITVVDTSR